MAALSYGGPSPTLLCLFFNSLTKQDVSQAIVATSSGVRRHTGYLYSAQRKWRNGENNRLGLGLG